MKNKIIYKIIDRKTGLDVGIYSRAYHDEFEFDSKENALNAHYSNMYKDKSKYKVSKYELNYKLIKDDC